MREAKFRNVEVVKNEPDRWLGSAILLALLAPQLYASMRWLLDQSYQPNQFFVSSYILFVGVIFLVSYYLPEKSFVFRGFLWFCERASAPASRKMAFFYFALCMFLGVAALVNLG